MKKKTINMALHFTFFLGFTKDSRFRLARWTKEEEEGKTLKTKWNIFREFKRTKNIFILLLNCIHLNS